MYVEERGAFVAQPQMVAEVDQRSRQIRVAYAIAAVYGAWTVASLLAIALRTPMKAPWQDRDGSRNLFIRWTVIEVIGCVLDLVAVLFSASLVWSLQMPLKKRMSVSAIFATRLIIWPIVALRLWKLYPSSSAGPTTPNITAEVLTQVVMETALNLASVTCMRPFLRPFQESGFILTSTQEGGGPPKYNITGASRTRSESYLMLGTAGSTTRNKNGSVVQTTASEKERGEDGPQRRDVPRARLRADLGHNEAACEHDAGRGHGSPVPKAIRVSRTVQVRRQDDM
ncbi:hypothetical protein LTR53_010916 [Teratosphaeriaceae sp. CCFEE 6253]|nr:hypothetical protein LTR53_010916 [Teratosphaeriaceae sp. CCFEE 6253]